jgi:hypothetical protein
MVECQIFGGGQLAEQIVNRLYTVERPRAERFVRVQFRLLDGFTVTDHAEGTVNLSSMELLETRSVEYRPAIGMITRPSPHQ